MFVQLSSLCLSMEITALLLAFRNYLGLRQGYSLSLFIFLAIKALSYLLKKAKEMGFISSFKVEGKSIEEIEVSYQLFVDEKLIFVRLMRIKRFIVIRF